MRVVRDNKGRFKKGNNIRLGSKHSKESLKKMSKSLKGKEAWNRVDLDEDELRRLYIVEEYSITKISKILSVGKTCVHNNLKRYKIKRRPAGFKENHPIFDGSEKGWFKKGHKPKHPIKKGQHLSKETQFKKGQNLGEDNPNWNGGTGYEPYTSEFNDKLKEFIRFRDNYTCQKCGKFQEDNGKKLAVHHIDYNKENCDKKNLITLCNCCNAEVNIDREHWKKHFQREMSLRPNTEILCTALDLE